jgi:hypothetical protein
LPIALGTSPSSFDRVRPIGGAGATATTLAATVAVVADTTGAALTVALAAVDVLAAATAAAAAAADSSARFCNRVSRFLADSRALVVDIADVAALALVELACGDTLRESGLVCAAASLGATVSLDDVRLRASVSPVSPRRLLSMSRCSRLRDPPPPAGAGAGAAGAAADVSPSRIASDDRLRRATGTSTPSVVGASLGAGASALSLDSVPDPAPPRSSLADGLPVMLTLLLRDPLLPRDTRTRTRRRTRLLPSSVARDADLDVLADVADVVVVIAVVDGVACALRVDVDTDVVADCDGVTTADECAGVVDAAGGVSPSDTAGGRPSVVVPSCSSVDACACRRRRDCTRRPSLVVELVATGDVVSAVDTVVGAVSVAALAVVAAAVVAAIGDAGVTRIN